MLTYTTTPTMLTDAIEKLLSPLKVFKIPVSTLAMMMTLALRFIPTLIDEIDRITNAQKARGANLEDGTLIERVKALVPIIVPLFVSSIRRAYELADAMDCRCYTGGPGRTRMKQMKFHARDFVAFSVTPRMGDKIRAAANRGGLNAIVESDGRRYVGEFPAVTALLPGESEEEIWLLAHTAEPFLDDDSAGVTAGIEIIRRLKEFKNRKYSVRVIFTLEMYGFAAFHAQFKGRVLGGINLDALVCASDYHINIVRPTPGKLFHGMDIIEKLYETLKDEIHLELGSYEIFDDMF
jgi:hypothetical protein